MKGREGITLADLLAVLPGMIDDIYLLIARELIYVDLHRYVLAKQEKARVFSSEDAAVADTIMKEAHKEPSIQGLKAFNVEPGTPLEWNRVPWTIVNVGNTITLRSDNSLSDLPGAQFLDLVKNGSIVCPDISTGIGIQRASEIFLGARQEDLKAANDRHRIIMPHFYEKVEIPEVDERTLRRWRAAYREAETLYGDGYLGLIPKHRLKGRREPRFCNEIMHYMNEAIELFEGPDAIERMQAYGSLKTLCEKAHLDPPSKVTFFKALDNRRRHTQILKREGSKAAYPYEIKYWLLGPKASRHGDRPFEVVHIDHTELDIEIVSRTGRVLGRPWLTLMMDAFSRRVLGHYLSFDPPHRKACMMVLRDSVSRFNRTAQCIVVDGGKEFHSIYFDQACTRLKIVKKTRPPARARHGSVMERLFGVTTKTLINSLPGNTKIMKNVRRVSKNVNPKKLASLTLGDLEETLSIFFYDIYDTTDHTALEETPRQLYERRLAETGYRQMRMVPYDENFHIMTLLSPPKETAKVQPGRGVRINYSYYWTARFKDGDVENTSVKVRYDPFNIGIAYAYLDGKWVQCWAEYYEDLKEMTERELKILTEEIRATRRLNNEKYDITAARIAALLKQLRASVKLKRQRMTDAEERAIRRSRAGEAPTAKKDARHKPPMSKVPKSKDKSTFGRL